MTGKKFLFMVMIIVMTIVSPKTAWADSYNVSHCERSMATISEEKEKMYEEIWDAICKEAGHSQRMIILDLAPWQSFNESDIQPFANYAYYKYFPGAVPEVKDMECWFDPGDRSIHYPVSESLKNAIMSKAFCEEKTREFAIGSSADINGVINIADKILQSTYYQYNYVPTDGAQSLFEGKGAVCDGYTRAFDLILNNMGIESYYVYGTGVKGTPHCWNMFVIDGKVYSMDLAHIDEGFSMQSSMVEGEFHDGRSVDGIV